MVNEINLFKRFACFLCGKTHLKTILSFICVEFLLQRGFKLLGTVIVARSSFTKSIFSYEKEIFHKEYVPKYSERHLKQNSSSDHSLFH